MGGSHSIAAIRAVEHAALMGPAVWSLACKNSLKGLVGIGLGKEEGTLQLVGGGATADGAE